MRKSRARKSRLKRGEAWAHENEPDEVMLRLLVPSARQLWIAALENEKLT